MKTIEFWNGHVPINRIKAGSVVQFVDNGEALEDSYDHVVGFWDVSSKQEILILRTRHKRSIDLIWLEDGDTL